MKLRLFQIRSLTTGKTVPDLYFSDKVAAKKKRDELGAEQHRVTYGPDHRSFRAGH